MNIFEQFRLRRQKIYEDLFSARILCFTGFLIMPAILFNPVLQSRIIQFLFFWFLCWLAGKKNNPLITIFVILGIVAFNLLVPHGRVLYTIPVPTGTFRITLGALMLGIHRAVTLQGLIMLSRLLIRRDLKIPGSFGQLIGESLRIFAKIMDTKHRITRKNFMADIDRLMLELSEDGEQSSLEPCSPAIKTKTTGFIILAAVVILSWLPWFITK